MTGPGFLILLSREDAKKLFALRDPVATRDFVKQLTDSADYREDGNVLELGNTWDTLHRCLTDGTLDPTAGEPPLNNALLGGRSLYKGEDYIAALVRPDMAPFVAEALQEVTYDQLQTNYRQINPQDYGHDLTDKDFEKAWVTFQQVRTFYDFAAQELSAVVFAAQLKK